MSIDSNSTPADGRVTPHSPKKPYTTPALTDLDSFDNTTSKAYSTQVENAFTGTLPS